MVESRRQEELQVLHGKLKFTGRAEFRLYDKDRIPDYKAYMRAQMLGYLEDVTLQKATIKNLVVNAGLNQIILLINGGTVSTFSACGVGSGTNTPTATDTDLQTPITRIAVTNIYQAANVGHWDSFFNSSTGNGTWAESGLFTTTTLGAGTMLCRLLISPTFTKNTSNTATIAWTITCSAV